MKPLSVATLVVLAAATCPAGPTDKAILAAMKLSEKPNYSWTSTVMDDARTYDIEGKTDQRGWTWMRLPMVKSIAQRLGRDADVEVEAVFKGNEAFVIQTDKGWQTLSELPKKHRDWIDDDAVWVMPRSTAGSWGTGGGNWGLTGNPMIDPNDPFQMDPFPVVLHRTPGRFDRDESKVYSNVQFGVSRPHEELAVIVSSYTDLKVGNDVVAGSLSELGAQLLLVRDGQDRIQASQAAGVFKLLIQNGVVTRYQVQLEGFLFVDRKRVHVRQLSNTTVRGIGASPLEIPDEIRRKLGE